MFEEFGQWPRDLCDALLSTRPSDADDKMALVRLRRLHHVLGSGLILHTRDSRDSALSAVAARERRLRVSRSTLRCGCCLGTLVIRTP